MKTSGLKKHSFWLLFGAVPLLVGLGVLMILSSVGGATAERKKEYDAQKTEIAGAKPKGKGVGVELSKQKGQLDTKVTALWGENFQQQKNAGLFKWPTTLKNNTELAILEKRNLPFGDDLVVSGDKDPAAPKLYYLDANQSELAEFATANVYQKAYKDMTDKVFPTRFGRGGPAAPAGGEEGPPGGGPRGAGGLAAPGMGGPGMPGGGLQNNQGDGWQAVLRHVTEWGTTAKPTVPELWLALEDIWVQRELLAVVERTNKALTQFEPEFAFWNYNPLKRTFVSRLWAIDLEVVTEASRKYLKATVRNPNDRLQMLGASKVMRLKVWLDNPADAQPSLSDYVIGGELVPGRGTMDVPFQKTDPRNKVLPGSHAIPLDRLITRISKVEQILDEVSVPVKLIQALELGVTDHRRGVATFVAPKLKGLPEDAAADPSTSPPMSGGRPGMGGDGDSLGPTAGAPAGPGGLGGIGGAAAAKTGTKQAVLLGNKLRYVEATDQVLRMPVALSVVLDLAFEQDLLVQFTNSPMRFHVTQTGWQRFRGSLPRATPPAGGGLPGVPGQPGPGQPGQPGQPGGPDGEVPGGFGGPTSAAVTAQANAGLVTLAVYGVVSLYNEMPLTEVRLDASETFEAGSNWKEPTKVSTDEELAKLFPDAATQAKVRAAFDLRSHDLLAFAWEGPAGDKVTFTVADQAAKFGLAPGEAKDGDKVQHRKLFAVRRTVKWSVE